MQKYDAAISNNGRRVRKSQVGTTKPSDRGPSAVDCSSSRARAAL